MPAVKLAAPRAPEVKQPPGLAVVADQDGRQSGRVSLDRIEAVLLDVLDNARRLLAADLEKIGQLAATDAALLALALDARAKAVGVCGLLLFQVAQPKPFQGLHL